MDKNNEITIYWSSPDFGGWNILYEEPKNCYQDLLSNIENDHNNKTFFSCPSFKDYMKNTFVIKNPIKSHFVIDNDNSISIKSKNYINSKIPHKPSIKNNKLIEYGISHYFFAEEDIDAFFTPPFFHDSPHKKYGAVVPGRWNPGAWIRPINSEFNLWEDINEIEIEENEPIAYVYFNTNKRVKLKRFLINEKILDISNACVFSTSWEKGVPLLKRYKRFKESKTNKIVLQEIKRNLVE